MFAALPLAGGLILATADTPATAAEQAAARDEVAGIDSELLGELRMAARAESAEAEIPLPDTVERTLEAWEEEAAREAAEQAAEPEAEAIGGGEASYYGRELAGNRTASGEIFDPSGLTAAHRTLPMGSRVRVTHRRNGRSVVVRINDRGPFHGNRVIDLSEGAARQIGMVGAGRAQVGLELLAD
ncbi:MAG: septal ring lytic transglycosylase RlpA family protein [Parasphingopyxis sp.]|nr:septal ring lytic transglycosylase RlpA family protein [Sphingomonadales bacterium]